MPKIIKPDHEYLQYDGRIDFTVFDAPILVYPYSGVHMNFKGTSIKLRLKNNRQEQDNYLGYIIDRVQKKILLPEENKEVCLTLEEGLEDDSHEIFVFKRMGACHEVTLLGFELPEEGQILKPSKRPRRCMEFYGDSVTAGEVSEAIGYEGKEDPVNNGELSNSYFSYAAITARTLHARANLIAQGGIALMDGTGYFNGPDYLGMESIYDKIRFNPALGETSQWNFSQYTPHVVVAAIGQNDSNPVNFMKEDVSGELAEKWRVCYRKFILKLREQYPCALIILSTTILNHSPHWDREIGKICVGLGDKKIVHFLYSENGRGTPGHARIAEAEQMALELSTFIRGFGEKIWQ